MKNSNLKPEIERTLVLLKPLSMYREAVEKVILEKLADLGDVTASVAAIASREDISQHYLEHKNEPWFDEFLYYYEGQKIVAVIVEGKSIITRVKEIVGPWDHRLWKNCHLRKIIYDMLGENRPERVQARLQDIVFSGQDNAIHAAGTREEAERQICIWFPDKKIKTF